MKNKILIFLLVSLSISSKSQSLTDVLSTEEKILGLSKIWSEVNYNFVFLDKLTFDFDSLYKATIPKVIEAKDNFEYINVLRTFMKSLNDGHTGILTPQFYWDQGDYPPVFLTEEDGAYFVRSIAKKYSSKIPIGSRLIKADGLPYSEYKLESPSGNLFSYLNTKVVLEFKLNNGEFVKQEFTRNFNHLYRIGAPIEMIDNKRTTSNNRSKDYEYSQTEGYSVVKINTFGRDTIIPQFQNDIDRINNSKGLIIDVRNNGGGNSNNAIGIAQHIVKINLLVGPMWKTKINNGAKKAWGSMALYGKDDEWTTSNKTFWKNEAWEVNAPDTTFIDPNIDKVLVPVIILMGEKTFSAAEDFLIYTMGNENIQKIGQNSAGSSGQPMILELPGGLTARICAKRDALPSGEDYIGIGIKPDIEIKEDVDAIDFAIKQFKQH